MLNLVLQSVIQPRFVGAAILLVDTDPRARWVDAMIGSIPRGKKEPRERLYRRVAYGLLARRRARAADGRGHAHTAGG